MTASYYSLMKQKEKYYETAVRHLLKEEIPVVLAWLRITLRSGKHFTGSCLCWSEYFHACTSKEIPAPVCKKKVIMHALVPSIASLATIAVESLSSFLQRKRNKAMAKGLEAIRQDQSFGLEFTKAARK